MNIYTAVCGYFRRIYFCPLSKGGGGGHPCIGLRFLTDLTMALARKNEVVNEKLVKRMLKNNDLTEPETRKQLAIFFRSLTLSEVNFRIVSNVQVAA